MLYDDRNRKRALVITAHVEGIPHIHVKNADYNEIICADGGIRASYALGLHPSRYIGDYDSADQPDVPDLIKLPCRKNMTDSEAAIDLAIEDGCTDITILGGLGGRFDHTMGNIGMLAAYTGKIPHIEILDGWNRVFLSDPGTVRVSRHGFKYISIIAYGSEVSGITLRGVKYLLDDYTLSNETTRGVSNEIEEGCEEAVITHKSGRLLIIQSNDAD